MSKQNGELRAPRNRAAGRAAGRLCNFMGGKSAPPSRPIAETAPPAAPIPAPPVADAVASRRLASEAPRVDDAGRRPRRATAPKAARSGRATDAVARFRETVAQRRPLRRGGRQGRWRPMLKPRRDRDFDRNRSRRSPRCSPHSAASPNITLSDARRALRGAGGALDASSSNSGLDAEEARRRKGARRGRPGLRRQALHRRGVAGEPLFRFHPTGLCADLALGRTIWSARRRARPAHAARRPLST